MTPSPDPVRQMAPGQVPHWPPPWRDTHLPFFLLTPLMGLPSWAWGRQRGPGPLKSCLMKLLGEPHATKAFLLISQAPWSRWPVGETTDATTAKKDGEVCGGASVNGPRLEVQVLSDEGVSCEGVTATFQPVLQGPGPRALCDHSEERGCEEEKIVMETAASMSLPSSQEGDGEAGKTGTDPESRVVVTRSPLPRLWQPNPTQTTTGVGVQESQKAWVGQLGVGRQEEQKEAKIYSRAAEKREVQGPFSIPPSPFLRPWVDPPEDSTKKGSAAEKAEVEDPFSIPQSPFLRPWVYQSEEDTENEESEQQQDGHLGEADGATQTPTSLPSASRNVCTFFRGEDTDDEDDEEDSDTEEPEDPSLLPSAPLNTHVAGAGKDWGEDDEDSEDEVWEREDGDLGAAEGHASAPSTLLRNWMYKPGEEEEEEDEDSEATDSRSGASQKAWSPATGQPAEPRDFQVAFYLPGEKPPPPWDPPRPPLWLWLRLQCTKPYTPPPEPVMPVKDKKVRFSEKVTVHLLAVWAGPARAARRGPWEQMARDRSRFARRIAQAQKDLGPYLTAVARARARARLRKLEASHPTPALATSSGPLLAMPLSPAVASPHSPPPVPDTPGQNLKGRRG